MASFLLAFFSEEIPSRMQPGAETQLSRLFEKALREKDISHGKLSTYSSPRHLAIHIADLPEILADRVEEKKGPKVGAPEKALEGFAKSVGLTLDACEQREIGKDTYYFASKTIAGGKVAELLPEITQRVLQQFTWPKSMRWGSHAISWVRPLHAMIALFDDQVLPIEFGHLTASNTTYGHRFLSPEAINITHADQYAATLEKHHVMVDATKRKALIRKQVGEQAAALKLTVVEDEALLDEIAGLVESPTTYAAAFDSDFLNLPKEVLISEMKHHQRYISLMDSTGKLQNSFLIVSNMPEEKVGAAIGDGNARVLRARLSDGAFYYHTDQETPLKDWAKKLDDVVFHAKVGMMSEKVSRIETLAVKIAECVGDQSLNRDAIRDAATLCKADLTTGMVGEFPELQGIMGRYYATAQGLNDEICEAIYEHYKPLGAADSLPETPVGAMISLADKLDSIISLWAAGEKPTGSKDPLALRRAAIGILRILDARGWTLDLNRFFPEANQQELEAFFTDRIKNMLREEGIRHDIIDATLHAQHAQFTPSEIFARVRRFADWLQTDTGEKTTAAIRRAMNIVAAEEKKHGTPFALEQSHAAMFTNPAETKLHETLKNCVGDHHTDALNSLTALADPIEAFFDSVLVNDENLALRQARLGLLSEARNVASKYADFSKLEGN